MPSPHIIDIRWRMASEEKAARKPPQAPPWGNWRASRMDSEWGIVQYGPDCGGRAPYRFIPTSQAEFDKVNARFKD